MRAFRIIFQQTVRAEFADRERLISPLLFAMVVLVVIAFTFGEPASENRSAMFIAQVFLSLMLATQAALSRTFEPEIQDKALDLLRTSPVPPTAIFLAKLAVVIMQGSSILIPAITLSALFCSIAPPAAELAQFAALCLLTVAGLASLGLTLAAMTHRAHARTVLFPLLYFPLATPLLLAGSQGGLAIVAPGAVVEAASSVSGWITISAATNVIFLTLGVLLFGEMLKSD